MRNIKITYKYDGTDFFGMQRQPKLRTVAGEIEKILLMLLKEQITMINSGRTDRGVHALTQTSNFHTKGKIPLDRLEYALAKALPRDIKLINIEEVTIDFNARYDALWRSYEYRLSSNCDIFNRNRVMWVEEEIDVEKLKVILKPLIGEHDFSSFRKADCQANNPIREIYNIDVYKKDGDVVIYLKANSFLKSMVRIIVGSALAVYFGKEDVDYIEKKLSNPNKQGDGKYMAEAQGLYLYEVVYENSRS